MVEGSEGQPITQSPQEITKSIVDAKIVINSGVSPDKKEEAISAIVDSVFRLHGQGALTLTDPKAEIIRNYLKGLFADPKFTTLPNALVDRIIQQSTADNPDPQALEDSLNLVSLLGVDKNPTLAAKLEVLQALSNPPEPKGDESADDYIPEAEEQEESEEPDNSNHALLIGLAQIIKKLPVTPQNEALIERVESDDPGAILELVGRAVKTGYSANIIRKYNDFCQRFPSRAEETIPVLQALSKLEPLNPDVHHTLGDVYLSLGRYAEAIIEYRTKLAIPPTKGA